MDIHKQSFVILVIVEKNVLSTSPLRVLSFLLQDK